MDFTSAMETFAEAWVAANTQTAVTEQQQQMRPTPIEELPTMLSKDQMTEQTNQQVRSLTAPPPTSATTTSPTSVSMATHTVSPSKLSPPPQIPATTAKSLPIHCIVEHHGCPPGERGSGGGGGGNSSDVDLDTYAILPSSTLFSEIVRTALTKLGYTVAEAMGAKGAIQIKNWKPLTFDTITENPDATVDEILGELTSLSTLRIRLSSRSKINTVDDVKDKLLQFLLQHSQQVLTSAGCPIEKNMLRQISKGDYPVPISEDMWTNFENWYKNKMIKDSQAASTSLLVPKLESHHRFDPARQANGVVSYPTLRNELNSSNYMARSRIRTSFDPDLEIPRLQAWYQQNQHPSREQMMAYLSELNSLESRRGRKPLDLTNIIYWFKNARAAMRRASRSMDSSGNEGHPEHDDSFEEHLSPAGTEHGDQEEQSDGGEEMPVLPNRNAVYVVSDPLHYPGMTIPESNECPGSPVIQIMPRSPEEDHDRMDTSEAPSGVFDRSDKSQRQERHHVENGDIDDAGKENIAEREPNGRKDSHSSDSVEDSGGDEENDRPMPGMKLPIKWEKANGKDHMDRSNTSSPLTGTNFKTMTLSQQLSQPPPAHQQPLNMTILPHPLNMHYMTSPSHPIYGGLKGSPTLDGRQFKEINSPQMSDDHRKKRSRVFIDPLSEIPKLEKWFLDDTHPSSYMIEKYTEELNRSEYRQRFPRLEPKNVQLWFKNHRAKVKRARLETSSMGSTPDMHNMSSEAHNLSSPHLEKGMVAGGTELPS